MTYPSKSANAEGGDDAKFAEAKILEFVVNLLPDAGARSIDFILIGVRANCVDIAHELIERLAIDDKAADFVGIGDNRRRSNVFRMQSLFTFLMEKKKQIQKKQQRHIEY